MLRSRWHGRKDRRNGRTGAKYRPLRLVTHDSPDRSAHALHVPFAAPNRGLPFEESLVQLLESNSGSVACGSQSVDDAVVLALDLACDHAFLAELAEPLLQVVETI